MGEFSAPHGKAKFDYQNQKLVAFLCDGYEFVQFVASFVGFYILMYDELSVLLELY